MVIQVKKEVKTTVLQDMVISFPTYTMDGNGKWAYGIFSPTEIIQVRIDNSDIIKWKHLSVSNCGIDQAFNGEGNRMIDSATFFAFYDKAIEQITAIRKRIGQLNNILSLDVEFLGMDICFEAPIDEKMYQQLNIGAVTLSREGREFMIDVATSILSDDKTSINCEVKTGYEDANTFPDCKFDLTKYDIIYGVEGRIFIDGNLENPKSITLFVKLGETTKAIDLIIE